MRRRPNAEVVLARALSRRRDVRTPASSAAPSFSEALARPGGALAEHLTRVADRVCAGLAGMPADVVAAGALAGLCHDLGKATSAFQRYLRDGIRTPQSRHAAFGAVWAWWAGEGLPGPLRLAATLAVDRHHTSLGDSWADSLGRLRRTAAPEGLVGPLFAAADIRGIAGFLRHAGQTRGLQPPEAAPTPADLSKTLPSDWRFERAVGAPLTLADALRFLAIFGNLLVADRSDVALAGGRISRVALPSELVARYRDATFGPPRTPLDRRRTAIAAAVRQRWTAADSQRLFTLTAPTGSGKTLAILDAALAARARRSRPARILYCLPFTSIVDQNEEVIREVLAHGDCRPTSDVLLKHHHFTTPTFRTRDDREYGVSRGGRLFTEAWQSEIVVSTFHQLLHSLLSRRGRDLQRVAALVGAIVVLDEVQALPLRYWRSIARLLRRASEVYDTTFVLMTATLPFLFEPAEAVELLPDHRGHFAALERVRLRCHHRTTRSLADLAEHLAERHRDRPRSCLVVLNRRRAVARLRELLLERLPGRSVWALSKDLRPIDLARRIRAVRARLAAGEPILVVSTQLVEAGVDLSFQEVHRDLGPLDCVLQAAGRCNRHDEEATAVVRLWRLSEQDGSEELWRRVYDPLLVEATVDALGSAEERREREFPELTARYFGACRARGAQVDVTADLAEGGFERLDERFALIEERPNQSFFVALDDRDRALWAAYQAHVDGADDAGAFRTSEREFLERVVQTPVRNPGPDVILVGSEAYDEDVGLRLDEVS